MDSIECGQNGIMHIFLHVLCKSCIHYKWKHVCLYLGLCVAVKSLCSSYTIFRILVLLHILLYETFTLYIHCNVTYLYSSVPWWILNAAFWTRLKFNFDQCCHLKGMAGMANLITTHIWANTHTSVHLYKLYICTV